MSASIQLILNQQISYVVHHLPSGTYNLPDDSGKLAQEILIGLGLITRTSAPPTFPPRLSAPLRRSRRAQARATPSPTARRRRRAPAPSPRR